MVFKSETGGIVFAAVYSGIRTGAGKRRKTQKHQKEEWKVMIDFNRAPYVGKEIEYMQQAISGGKLAFTAHGIK